MAFSLDLLITDFGALGDGHTDDTWAFEEAIAQIASNGGGRLLVSANNFKIRTTYLIRPINLTSHMILYIQSGATILGVADEAVWPIVPALPSYGQGRDHPGPRYTSLLHGEHLVNVTIQGEGEHSVIDGNGEYWYQMRWNHQDRYTRGSLVEFLYSQDIRLYHFQMKDSPFWNTHLYDCDNVHVKHVQIVAPMPSPNTDGWDPDSSRNVLIEDSSYSGGDDCVSVKSGWDCFGLNYGKPATNITLRNLTCDGWNAAGIALGSEMSGGIENILVEQIYFPKFVNRPINIKVGKTRGGYIKNATFRNIQVSGTVQQAAIDIDMIRYSNNGSENPSCASNWTPPSLPALSDLFFINITGTTATITANETYHIMAFDDSPIQGLFMRNVHFGKPTGNGSVVWHCQSAKGKVVNGSVAPWPPCKELDIIPANAKTLEKASTFVINVQQQNRTRFCALVFVLFGCFWFLLQRAKQSGSRQKRTLS